MKVKACKLVVVVDLVVQEALAADPATTVAVVLVALAAADVADKAAVDAAEVVPPE
jgi:hypothetical protein